MEPIKTTSKISTIQTDIEEYGRQRALFLKEYLSFRYGQALAGQKALDLLLTCYIILPMGIYVNLDDKDSEQFMREIDAIRSDIGNYIQKNGADGTKDKEYYQQLRKMMDEIVSRFYKIMQKCGYMR